MNEQSRLQKMSLLHIMLNSEKIDINAQDIFGSTALSYSVMIGTARVTEMLLEKGADPNLSNGHGSTPLHKAVQTNEYRIIGLLLNSGASVTSDKDNIKPSDLTNDPYTQYMLQGMRTSHTHPLDVDFIDSTHCPELGRARIGMSMCPGRNKKIWRRSLDADIEYLEELNIDVVVSLVTNTELNAMNITELLPKVQSRNMEAIHLSIQDKWIPQSMEDFSTLIEVVLHRVLKGKTVLIHCNGGKGRTGLVTVALLMQLGMSQESATNLMRSIRSGMLRNPAQIQYLKSYQKKYILND
eukprot:TRINITY_DN13483_c0_g1_i1.p1 TRINITY_DN13483_c0_g1~~TRINITY_DN13483_c0_g1_i1.p1  ORF type:complete len:330 (+),score=35.05 TRINITY_DN13483_c0_g1_i1:100-990(+)